MPEAFLAMIEQKACDEDAARMIFLEGAETLKTRKEIVSTVQKKGFCSCFNLVKR